MFNLHFLYFLREMDDEGCHHLVIALPSHLMDYLTPDVTNMCISCDDRALWRGAK